MSCQLSGVRCRPGEGTVSYPVLSTVSSVRAALVAGAAFRARCRSTSLSRSRAQNHGPGLSREGRRLRRRGPHVGLQEAKEARIRKWEEYCKPTGYIDDMGITRVRYAHPGCDLGRSGDGSMAQAQ